MTLPNKAAPAAETGVPVPPAVLALVARQAIYDASKEVVAYELLFRRSETAATAQVVDGSAATLQVITNAVLEIGLDRLAGDLPVHINYPGELLVGNVVLPVPAKRVVIEVLETVRSDAAIMAGIAAMRARGHEIALDDFAPRVSDPVLLEVADTVKLDVSDYTAEELARMVAALKSRRFRLIAERVETAEEFERCVALGFDAFQGYFLQHPKVFSAKPVPSSRLGTLRLVALLQNEESSIKDVERLISQDVSLTYRVLRCINSSYYGLTKKIDSIRQAIVILGFEKLRQLCALIALRELEDRPPSVFIDAMTRARMCEKVGALRGISDSPALFITGLFSTLDVLTGVPMPEILRELPLSPAVAAALTTRDGALGAVLREVIAYERGDWSPVIYRGLAAEAMQTTYLEAVSWAEAAQGLVSG
jgi:c-di-GMP phosphodiesterase